jgi:hypothetical protein
MAKSIDPRVKAYKAKRKQLQAQKQQQSAQLANFKATQAQANAQ